MTGKQKLVITSVVVLGVMLTWVGIRHGKTEADDGNHATGAGERVAAVVKVEQGTLGTPLTLAGAFKPFQDVDVHAKVAGYIKEIYVDVGSHVKEGQTLAVLEVPELQAELQGADAAVRRSKEEIRRAQGDVERAKSAHAAVHSMFDRLRQASEQKAGLVAQQEVDNAQAKDLEAEAQVSSAEASLNAAQQALAVAQATQQQYKALSDYTRITAPYAGVVTVRYADTGSLIAAGTSESKQAEPVVKLAQISVLRLVLPIPESIAGGIRLGDPIKVHVQALDKDYVGKVARFADSLDPDTRTMHTEIDFQNSDGKLMPGMYVVATVPVNGPKNVLTVPLEAVDLKGRDEGTVLLVGPGNILEERKIGLGMQGSTRIQVTGGLQEGDQVVVGSRNEFRSGMKVQPKVVESGASGAAGES
ncbi:MAG TPA: efflux RND transporter periplasmic adaptor subunit [Candidatus Acidoferrum sp.]|nr:efflux RND transporter periplasmic adaptor subunit [Candidatus Acidoferrum sp.]